MYVKYPMVDSYDYRGNVALVVSSPDGQEIAYSNVDAMDGDMVSLIEDEVTLVKDRTDIVEWLSVRDELCRQVDVMADQIRESYKYPGQLTIEMEYVQVEAVLKEWQEAGSPLDDVPDEIQVWQDVTGNDLSWVVNDIESAIQLHRTMISSIRRLRLLGKKAITEASVAELNSTYDSYISQLEAIRAVPDY